MALKLEHFSPGVYVERIVDIDLAALVREGAEAVLVDLDNTLLPWKSSAVPESSRVWIAEAKRLGIKICIVSNTHYPRRLRRIASELGVASIDRAVKPRRNGCDEAARMLGVELSRCVVVGDQLLTDILGGNLAGASTILVRPMDKREFVGTKISRLVEKLIFVLLERRGERGTKSRAGQSERRNSR